MTPKPRSEVLTDIICETLDLFERHDVNGPEVLYILNEIRRTEYWLSRPVDRLIWNPDGTGILVVLDEDDPLPPPIE